MTERPRVKPKPMERRVREEWTPAPELEHRPSGKRTVDDDVLCTCHAVMSREDGAYVCPNGRKE